MNKMITQDEVEQILKKIMHGETKWFLGEVEEYQTKLKLLNTKSHGIRRREQKAIQKRINKLKKKIQMIDYKNSNLFVSEDVPINSGRNLILYRYRVEVCIYPEYVELRFLNRRAKWADFSASPDHKWVTQSTVTSKDNHSVGMLPFLLRNKDIIIFQ